MILIRVKLKVRMLPASEIGKDAISWFFKFQFERMIDEAVSLVSGNNIRQRRDEAMYSFSDMDFVFSVGYSSDLTDFIAKHISECIRHPEIEMVSVLGAGRIYEVCHFLGSCDVQAFEVGVRYMPIIEYMVRTVHSGAIVTSNDSGVYGVRSNN